ncbi:hypothetical protein BpHYR1_028061 [Brachionus plicatilis]|uniref:Uncharacterized protein n=1 Tax=Brachionus plicatilis TaxID=10195 RepID=A0A3M7SPU5_BRAPC|nr:hypothetical protein BpHYR1_028061 [Brachionus plicatilis]
MDLFVQILLQGTFIWSMFLLINVVFVNVLKKWLRKRNWRGFDCLEGLIDQFNSFSIITDSRFTACWLMHHTLPNL